MLLEETLKTFFLPEYILKKIEFTEEAPYLIRLKNFLIWGNKRNARQKSESIFFSLSELLKQKYGEGEWQGNKKGNLNNILFRLFWESLKNGFEHGNKNDPEKYVIVVLYLGEKGLTFGFRDEGDFYKNESIKISLESKEAISSTRTDYRGGAGTANYRSTADIIYVDTETGTLYLTYLLRRESRTEDWAEN